MTKKVSAGTLDIVIVDAKLGRIDKLGELADVLTSQRKRNAILVSLGLEAVMTEWRSGELGHVRDVVRLVRLRRIDEVGQLGRGWAAGHAFICRSGMLELVMACGRARR